jgi:hypothetical protein
MAGFEKVATSDPAKVAAVVIRLTELDEPPLRLLVGSDAYEYGREAWAARLQTDATWEDLSRSTDADDGAEAWRAQRGSSLPQRRS